MPLVVQPLIRTAFPAYKQVRFRAVPLPGFTLDGTHSNPLKSGGPCWNRTSDHLILYQEIHQEMERARPPELFLSGQSLVPPTLVFRRAYDALVERSHKWADLEYVRILHLAATTMQCEVEAVLGALLEAGEVPEYESVKARVVPGEGLACPEVHVTMPDLSVYDTLLEGEGVVA